MNQFQQRFSIHVQEDMQKPLWIGLKSQGTVVEEFHRENWKVKKKKEKEDDDSDIMKAKLEKNACFYNPSEACILCNFCTRP